MNTQFKYVRQACANWLFDLDFQGLCCNIKDDACGMKRACVILMYKICTPTSQVLPYEQRYGVSTTMFHNYITMGYICLQRYSVSATMFHNSITVGYIYQQRYSVSAAMFHNSITV